MAKILVSEDEKHLNELICNNLQLVGHETTSTYDGLETLKEVENNEYDLLLLDVMLPKLSGFEVKKQVPTKLPVIFVTAKDKLNSRLEGLYLGADDYVIKPFEILELLARVEAVLRRTKKAEKVFEFKGVKVELDTRLVFINEEEILLTPKEFQLLETLIINKNLALSRNKLLELVWDYDYEGESRTVDMHILHLRKKLNWDEVIQTVYKIGYRLNTRE